MQILSEFEQESFNKIKGNPLEIHLEINRNFLEIEGGSLRNPVGNQIDFHQKSNLFILIIAAHSLLFVSVLNAAPKIGVQNTLSNIKIIMSFSLLIIAQGLIRELFAYGTIFRDFDIIFGTFTSSWTIQVINENMIVPIFQTPVGAIFIYAFLITGVNYSVIKNRKKNINKP